jgi:histidyl-tRNA synthetase
MPTIATKPPSGTRDFLPEEIRKRQFVMSVIRDVYERYGYEPLETPSFENIETLLGKYGDEGNKLIFKILKRGEHEQSGAADLALRYDLTVPLARVIAQYQNELPRFFKRYQIQPVWRADRPAKGRFREFYQCDIDAIGSTSPVVEVEQLEAVGEVLTRLGFSDFVIRLNHRQVLTALLTRAGIDPRRHSEALVALDKLDKIGPHGVRAELAERGIDSSAANALVNWIGADPGRDAVTWLRRELEPLDAEGQAAFENLAQILGALERAESRLREPGAGTTGRIRFEPGLARGLSYYTGAIMEVAVPDLTGSLGGGGRYDNLIGMFLGRNVPACGFSLGLERILVVMSERAMFPAAVARGPVDIVVTAWPDAPLDRAVSLASALRDAGLRVEIYPEPDKLGKQFKYASGRRVPFVAVEGDDERAAGSVAIKDLRSGEQTSVARDQAGQFVLRRLSLT